MDRSIGCTLLECIGSHVVEMGLPEGLGGLGLVELDQVDQGVEGLDAALDLDAAERVDLAIAGLDQPTSGVRGNARRR
jgi:hypothetical protein